MSATIELPTARTHFELPAALSADRPPEARGLARDQVRLVVAGAGGTELTRFDRIGRHLRPGDLVVVNTSGTLAAAVAGTHSGRPVVVHVSSTLDGGDWVVELRRTDRSGPIRDAARSGRVGLPGGAGLTLLTGYPDPAVTRGSRLWRAGPDPGTPPPAQLLSRYGRPISYGYLHGDWPLSAYQTVFAREPGSAEMPSAGRPFSAGVVADLVARGVQLAPVLLHCAVSSPEAGEPPLPERFAVPAGTARLVNFIRRGGGRVVAVGTTVVRALESAAAADGSVRAAAGWTDLVLSRRRPVRVVDGLVTGWHEPGASHLLLLEAVAGPEPVARAYATALRERLLWHEFGDSCLLLPRRTLHLAAARPCTA